MKICLMTTSSQMAGAEKMLLELAIGLHDRDFDLLVITIKSEQDGRLLEYLRAHGIKTASLHMNAKWQIWKIARLFKLLRSFHPDILQSFLFFDNILARTIGRLAHVPIILSGQRNARHQKGIRILLEKLTLPLADKIVSNSSAGKDVLIDQFGIDPDKVDIIVNGIRLPAVSRPEAHELRPTQDKLHLGFVGHLTEQKGVDVLLRALARERSKNILCTIIGDGPEREPLEQLTHALDLQRVVKFLGARERAHELMTVFDVLVLPSLYEGMPNVIMEAMAHGVPVIASNVGGISQLVIHGETGFLVAPDDEIELSRTINTFVTMSKIQRQQMGELGRQRIHEHFDIETMIERFIELYEQLHNGRT